MSDIFLSYDSRDLQRARALASALNDYGWTVFFDRTIPPGQTWGQFIGKEIDECQCMIVAWSTNSISSHWVCEEADIGLKRKILVPILLDQVSPPLGFGSLQAASLVDWQGETESSGYLTLIKAVINRIGPGKLLGSKVEKAFNSSPKPTKTGGQPKNKSDAKLQNPQVNNQKNEVESLPSIQKPGKTKKSLAFWVGIGILVTSMTSVILIWVYPLKQKNSGGNEVSLKIWTGGKIYNRAFGRGCGSCHDFSSNPNLFESVKTLSKNEFITVLKNGRNGMPKATNTIMGVGPVKEAGYSEEQAYDAVYAYIKGRSDNSIPEGKLKKAK